MSFARIHSASMSRAVLRKMAVSQRQPSAAANLKQIRTYASQPENSSNSSSSSTKRMLISAALVGSVAGLGYWYFALGPGENSLSPTLAKIDQKLGQVSSVHKDYQKVYDRIVTLLEDENWDDGSWGPVFLRLAWHASGTYDKKSNTGGSNMATMRFPKEGSWGANNGLAHARERLEQVHKEFPWISYGDLWTLAGVCAVKELGGPSVAWRPGREDGTPDHDILPDGLLPDAALAHDHLRNIFYRMGFNDQQIVALSGAHSLGRCHTDRSGFEGPWQHSPTSFNNEYYKLLLEEKWGLRSWKGPKQYEDKSTKKLMMLPTDLSLIKDKSFRKHVEAYANDEELFFKDFASVVAQLFELGVPAGKLSAQPIFFKSEA